jgi:hypothetical protein
MPEGRDTLRPSVERLFKVFAEWSVGSVKDAQGRMVAARFAALTPVQGQVLAVVGLPPPAAIVARSLLNRGP